MHSGRRIAKRYQHGGWLSPCAGLAGDDAVGKCAMFKSTVEGDDEVVVLNAGAAVGSGEASFLVNKSGRDAFDEHGITDVAAVVANGEMHFDALASPNNFGGGGSVSTELTSLETKSLTEITVCFHGELLIHSSFGGDGLEPTEGGCGMEFSFSFHAES